MVPVDARRVTFFRPWEAVQRTHVSREVRFIDPWDNSTTTIALIMTLMIIETISRTTQLPLPLDLQRRCLDELQRRRLQATRQSISNDLGVCAGVMCGIHLCDPGHAYVPGVAVFAKHTAPRKQRTSRGGPVYSIPGINPHLREAFRQGSTATS